MNPKKNQRRYRFSFSIHALDLPIWCFTHSLAYKLHWSTPSAKSQQYTKKTYCTVISISYCIFFSVSFKVSYFYIVTVQTCTLMHRYLQKSILRRKKCQAPPPPDLWEYTLPTPLDRSIFLKCPYQIVTVDLF